MGLLDDAIREHLDLKRRGGADPAEIEKLEREALGPVRRERASSAVAEDIAREEEGDRAAPRRIEFEPRGGETGSEEPKSREETRSPERPRPREEARPPEETRAEATEHPADLSHEEMLAAIDEGRYEDDLELEDEEPRRKRRGFFRRRRAEEFEEDELDFEEDEDEYDDHDELEPYDEHDEELDHPETDQPSVSAREPVARQEPPHLEFEGRPPESRPPERPRFVKSEPEAHDEEPLVELEPTVEHRLPEAEPFPVEEEIESPEPPHGDPLEDQFDDLGHPTVEHSVEDIFAEEEASAEEELFPAAPPERPPARPAPPAERRSESSPEPDEDEDLLEETPDFLQDTPDHDRLWFEQKKPRDFDFDG